MRNGGASPKLAALVKTLRDHFEVSRPPWPATWLARLPAAPGQCVQHCQVLHCRACSRAPSWVPAVPATR